MTCVLTRGVLGPWTVVGVMEIQDYCGVLWRRSEWRCEYAPAGNRPGGTVRLRMESAVVAQLEIESQEELVQVSSIWRELIERPNDPDAFPAVGLRLMADRRQSHGNRRAGRGGRRKEDPR